MRMDFLSPADPRWTAFLRESPHQFYHLPAYAKLWAEQNSGRVEAILISHGDNYFFLPYIVSSLTENWSDMHSPYGYSGPIIRAKSRAFLVDALRRWSDIMRSRKIVSGFVRLDPLREYPNELMLIGDVCERGYTVSVDLTAPAEQLIREIRESVRRSILKARSAGLRFELEPYINWSDFQEHYRATMDRVGATRRYLFDSAHFQLLAKALGNRLILAGIFDSTQQALASGVFVEDGGVVQHHLQAASSSGLKLAACKCLVMEMILTAKARGNRLLHLGGGRGARMDSLFHFKAAFAKRRHRFATWHIRFAAKEYHRRTSGVVEQRSSSISPGFFPAYRAMEEV
jgi:hypothetical protein